jgi:hypothetical protein
MLPDLNYLPAEEILFLKHDELMREFREIRLLNAAREANPGFAERARAWIAALFHSGARLQQRRVASHQSYIDYALKLAA